MKNNSKQTKEYHSMEDYLQKFFPATQEKRLIESVSPSDAGEIIARNSLDKVRHQLLKK